MTKPEKPHLSYPSDLLDISKAMAFYERFTLVAVRDKAALRRIHGFEGTAIVSPGDWELFVAILTRQMKARNTYGHDLQYAEVKSASGKTKSFEYQYHRMGGRKKLESETAIDHIFINVWGALENMVVRVVSGERLHEDFMAFQAGLEQAYPEAKAGETVSSRQRYRPHISFERVQAEGKVLLEVEAGRLKSSSAESLERLFHHRRWDDPGLLEKH